MPLPVFRFLIVSTFVLCAVFAQAQTFKITGKIIDSETGEAVMFANCIDEVSQRATTTNNFGYFTLSVDHDSKITVLCLGYNTTTSQFRISSDTTVIINLAPKITNLSEVVVSSVVPQRMQVQMGKNTVSLETIKTMPSLTSEPDVVKTLTYLPGISQGREGYSSIFVRGGDRGQNLFLLDGIKIYSANHVGGFFSLFNSDIIKHVDVYKGGFPSQFGGRTSSIIDIATKDGNSQSTKANVTLGTLISSAFVESPFGKKASFYFGVRGSYYNMLVKSKKNKYKELAAKPVPESDADYSGYAFIDVNGRIKWNINHFSSLSLSFFLGNDYGESYDQYCSTSRNASLSNSRFSSDLTTNNQGISLTYVKSFGSLFWRNTVSASAYRNKQTDIVENNIGNANYLKIKSDTQSDIKDITFQSRIEYDLVNQKIKAGIEINRYGFNPGFLKERTATAETTLTNDTLIGRSDDQHSWENSVYVNDEVRLSKKLSVEMGIRGTFYSHADTSYQRIEPRVAFRLLFNDKMSLKANYTQMNQFNHVVVNSVDGFEKEIWIASTAKTRPQHADQVSVGLFYGDDQLKLNASIEAYYKKMNDLISFRPPVDETNQISNIEDLCIKKGKGKSKGIELLISKDFENLTMSVSYTLSRTERQFDNMNFGKWYSFSYDRTHDLSAVIHYRFNKKWSINSNFTYSTGRPFTLPVAKVGGEYLYKGINNVRMPAYHRLDIGCVRSFAPVKGVKSELNINVFNIYARQNATIIYYRDGKLYQKALFSILPSVSFRVSF